MRRAVKQLRKQSLQRSDKLQARAEYTQFLLYTRYSLKENFSLACNAYLNLFSFYSPSSL